MRRAMGWVLAAALGWGGSALAQTTDTGRTDVQTAPQSGRSVEKNPNGRDPSFKNAPVNPFGMKGQGSVGSSAASGMNPPSTQDQRDANAQRTQNGRSGNRDLDVQRYGRRGAHGKKARRHGRPNTTPQQNPGAASTTK